MPNRNSEKIQKYLTNGALAGIAAFLVAVFLLAQNQGGRTWDETIHVKGLAQQAELIGGWLQGNFSKNYIYLVGDQKYYGVAPVFVTYLVLEILKWVSPASDGDAVQAWTLHATGFVYGIGAVLATYGILRRLAENHQTAMVGAALLVTYPLWLGYLFFDYKDLATAFFFVLAVLASIALATGLRSNARRWAWILGLATIGAADTKLAALALIVPAWLVAVWYYGRVFPRTFVIVCLATAAGIYVTSLPGWLDPFGFALSSVEYMAHHAWGGCALTNGTCTGTHTAEWSAWQYALTWFWSQLPLTVLIGIVPAIGAALFRGVGHRIFAFSLVWPLAAIAIGNSTLYDGLRHLLFALPLAFALVVLLADQLIARWQTTRIPLTALAVGMLALSVVDDVRLFPFNYTYFNLLARQWADERWFETDYWGFSLKEAAEIASPLIPGNAVVAAEPAFLVQPFLPQGVQAVGFGEIPARVPQGTSYFRIYYTRVRAGADNPRCVEVGRVSRALAFTPVK